MAGARIPVAGNKLIAGMRPKAQREFLRRCETVPLAYGDILCEAKTPLSHVYLPTAGFISRIAILDGQYPLDMGLVGDEGMLGAIIALDAWEAPMRAVVHGAGAALRMTTPAFRRALRDIPSVVPIVHHYLYAMIAQLGRSSACTRFHGIEPRLARWLLMLHDRAHSDHFYITQESLADMLGVRRAGVTNAAGKLKRRKLIRYSRGEIDILERKGIEAAACSCYAALVRDIANVFPPGRFATKGARHAFASSASMLRAR